MKTCLQVMPEEVPCLETACSAVEIILPKTNIAPENGWLEY